MPIINGRIWGWWTFTRNEADFPDDHPTPTTWSEPMRRVLGIPFARWISAMAFTPGRLSITFAVPRFSGDMETDAMAMERAFEAAWYGCSEAELPAARKAHLERHRAEMDRG